MLQLDTAGRNDLPCKALTETAEVGTLQFFCWIFVGKDIKFNPAMKLSMLAVGLKKIVFYLGFESRCAGNIVGHFCESVMISAAFNRAYDASRQVKILLQAEA